jgi:hypothetical protein
MSSFNRKRKAENVPPPNAKRTKIDSTPNTQQPFPDTLNNLASTPNIKTGRKFVPVKRKKVHFTTTALDAKKTSRVKRTEGEYIPTLDQNSTDEQDVADLNTDTNIARQTSAGNTSADLLSSSKPSENNVPVDTDDARKRAQIPSSSTTSTDQQQITDVANKTTSTAATSIAVQKPRDKSTNIESTSTGTPQQSSSDVHVSNESGRKRKAESSDEPQAKRNKLDDITAASPGAMLKAGDNRKSQFKVPDRMREVFKNQLTPSKASAETELKRRERAEERKKKEQERKQEKKLRKQEDEKRMQEEEKCKAEEEQKRKAEEKERIAEELKRKAEEEKQEKEKKMAAMREKIKQKAAERAVALKAAFAVKEEEARKTKEAERRKAINFVPYSAESVPILYSTNIDHGKSNKLPYTPAWDVYVHALEVIQRAFYRGDTNVKTPTYIRLGRTAPNKGCRVGPALVIDNVDLYIHQRDVCFKDDRKAAKNIDYRQDIRYVETVYVAVPGRGLVSVDDYLFHIGVPDTQPVRFNGRTPNWARNLFDNAQKRRVVRSHRPSLAAIPDELELIEHSGVEIYEIYMRPWSQYIPLQRTWALGKAWGSDRIGVFPFGHDFLAPLEGEESYAKPWESLLWEVKERAEKEGTAEKPAADLLFEQAQQYEEMEKAGLLSPPPDAAQVSEASSASPPSSPAAHQTTEASTPPTQSPPATAPTPESSPTTKRDYDPLVDEVDWSDSDQDAGH